MRNSVSAGALLAVAAAPTPARHAAHSHGCPGAGAAPRVATVTPQASKLAVNVKIAGASHPSAGWPPPSIGNNWAATPSTASPAGTSSSRGNSPASLQLRPTATRAPCGPEQSRATPLPSPSTPPLCLRSAAQATASGVHQVSSPFAPTVRYRSAAGAIPSLPTNVQPQTRPASPVRVALGMPSRSSSVPVGTQRVAGSDVRGAIAAGHAVEVVGSRLANGALFGASAASAAKIPAKTAELSVTLEKPAALRDSTQLLADNGFIGGQGAFGAEKAPVDLQKSTESMDEALTLGMLQTQVSDLVQQEGTTDNLVADLERRMADLMSEMVRTKHDNATLRAALQQSESDTEVANARAERLQEELDALKLVGSAQQSESDIEAANARADRLQEELDTLKRVGSTLADTTDPMALPTRSSLVIDRLAARFVVDRLRRTLRVVVTTWRRRARRAADARPIAGDDVRQLLSCVWSAWRSAMRHTTNMRLAQCEHHAVLIADVLLNWQMERERFRIMKLISTYWHDTVRRTKSLNPARWILEAHAGSLCVVLLFAWCGWRASTAVASSSRRRVLARAASFVLVAEQLAASCWLGWRFVFALRRQAAQLADFGAGQSSHIVLDANLAKACASWQHLTRKGRWARSLGRQRGSAAKRVLSQQVWIRWCWAARETAVLGRVCRWSLEWRRNNASARALFEVMWCMWRLVTRETNTLARVGQWAMMHWRRCLQRLLASMLHAWRFRAGSRRAFANRCSRDSSPVVGLCVATWLGWRACTALSSRSELLDVRRSGLAHSRRIAAAWSAVYDGRLLTSLLDAWWQTATAAIRAAQLDAECRRLPLIQAAYRESLQCPWLRGRDARPGGAMLLACWSRWRLILIGLGPHTDRLLLNTFGDSPPREENSSLSCVDGSVLDAQDDVPVPLAAARRRSLLRGRQLIRLQRATLAGEVPEAEVDLASKQLLGQLRAYEAAVNAASDN